MSIEKTKGMATGDNVSEEDIAPVQAEGGEIVLVDHQMAGDLYKP